MSIGLGIIGEALKGLLGIIKEPLNEWQHRKTLEVEQEGVAATREHEIRLKKVDVATELAKQGIQVEADWDARAQEDMKHSWKDEILMFIVFAPFIAVFFPETQQHVINGFNALDGVPDWYVWLMLGIAAGIYGLRWMFGKFNISKRK